MEKQEITLQNSSRTEALIASAFADISQASGLYLNIWSVDLQIIYCNQPTVALFGLETTEQYLQNFSKLMPECQPDGVASAVGILQHVQQSFDQGNHQFYWLYTKLDGTELPCQISLIRHMADDGTTWVLGVTRLLESAFSGQTLEGYDYYFHNTFSDRDLLQTAMELTNEWFFVLDLRTDIIQYYGDLVYQHFGKYTIKASLGDALRLGYMHPEDGAIYEKIDVLVHKQNTEPVEIRYLQKDGSYRYYRMAYQVINNRAGTPVYIVAKGVDIHEEKQMKRQVERDQLTGCYNKISTELKIKELLSEHTHQSHTLLIVDIDNFKPINDNLGHYVGDHVLKEIAANIQGLFRNEDVIGRAGGDEFIIFATGMNQGVTLQKKAEALVEACRRTYKGIYRNYTVSASVGISNTSDVGYEFEALYKAADKALYRSKSQGKNGYTFYNQSLSKGALQGVTTIDQVNRSISAFFDYDLVASMFDILYTKAEETGIINKILGYIGEKFGVDRVYTFETFDHGKTYNNTFEWCKDGIPAEIDTLQNVEERMLQDYFWTAQHDLIYCSNLQEALKHSVAYEEMARQGILSFAHAQVRRDDHVSFFLGLDDCTEYRHWTEKELNSLRYIAKIMSLTIQNQRAQMEMTAIHQSRLAEEQFYRHCSEFLHNEENPHQSIVNLLAAFGEYYKAERGCLFMMSPDGKSMRGTHEWCAQGVKPQLTGDEDIPVVDFAEWLDGFERQGELCMELTSHTSDSRLCQRLLSIGITSVITAPLRGEGGRVIGFVGVDNPERHTNNTIPMRSVCEFIANFLYRTQLLENLRQLSYYDPLTGLKNRNSYVSFANSLKTLEVKTLASAYLDVRELERINRRQGMLVGDEVIKEVAEHLSQAFSRQAYRLNGHEFAVLMVNESEADFEARIADFDHGLGNHLSEYGIILGYTCSEIPEGAFGDTCIDYREVMARNLDTEITTGKFQVFLQPQLNIENNAFDGAEALIRRFDSQGNPQAPAVFVPFYEKEGLIHKIDLYVFQRVCQVLTQWQEQGYGADMKVSVNFSRNTIREEHLMEQIESICQQYPVERSRIIIEITETVSSLQDEELVRILTRLKEAGFTISLDDFGQGYSNLNTLKLSDFNELKLDRSLIEDVHLSDKSVSIARVALDLCNELDGLVSVAEGIENEEQYHALKEMHCNRAQGYYFDKPMPVEEFTKKYVHTEK